MACLVVAVVEAATTPWACEGGTNNHCVDAAKYARGHLHYTILGGNGEGTDWRFDKREYGGSLGGTQHSEEEWQLYWGGDFVYDGGWSRVHKYGASQWYRNRDPWDGDTISGARNVYGKQGISWYTVFQHYHCSNVSHDRPNEMMGCSYEYKYREKENSVFN